MGVERLDAARSRSPFPAVPRTWSAALQALGLLALLLAYKDLLSLGHRYGFTTGVEYWLFRPSDRAPLVIIALSLWLVYRRRHAIAALERRLGSWRLIAPSLLAGSALYAWAVYTSADDLQVPALALHCLGLAALYWGAAGLRVLWLPIAFLLFSIPLPAPLLLAVVFKLQLWTAQCTGWLLYVIGVPALVSGDQILRASQSFQVIDGCSGQRSIETLTMLTVLLIDLFRRRGLHAGLLFAVAPLVAFALNSVRVLTLTLNPHSEIVAVHNFQGVAILLAGLLVIYALDGLLERLLPPRDGSAIRAPGARASSARSGRAPLVVLSVVAAVMTGAAHLTPVWEDTQTELPSLSETLTDALQEWHWSKLEEDFFFRGGARFGQVVSRKYQLVEAPVYVFVATSDLAQRGGSAISPVTALPGTGWVVLESEPRRFEPAGPTVDARLLEKGKQRLLVHHWYEGARGLANEAARSLFALDRSALRRHSPLLVVRLGTPIAGRGAEERALARSRLDRVHERLYPALQSAMLGRSPLAPPGT